MPRKPTPDVDLEDDELEQDEKEKSIPARDAETPFDPWGDEEEANDRRRDPLRSPI